MVSSPAADIPTDEEARIAWLYDWWERIDAWVTGHAEPGLHSATWVRPGD